MRAGRIDNASGACDTCLAKGGMTSKKRGVRIYGGFGAKINIGDEWVD